MEQQTEDEKGLTPITEPFSIAFTWEDKYVKVKFKKSEDVLKLGQAFSKYLTENGIENTIDEN